MLDARIARLRDRLTGALIGLARATDGNEHLISQASTALILEGLADAGTDPEQLERLLERVAQEKRNMVPNCFTCACPCGRTNDYDMQLLWNGDGAVGDMKSLILLGLRGLAADMGRLERREEAAERLLYKALNAIGMDHWTPEGLLPLALEVGEAHRKYMALPR